MEVIDKILNEWSFRCHDGIVDMNDPIKLSILKEVLIEYNILNEDIDDDILTALSNLEPDDSRKEKVLNYIKSTSTEKEKEEEIEKLKQQIDGSVKEKKEIAEKLFSIEQKLIERNLSDSVASYIIYSFLKKDKEKEFIKYFDNEPKLEVKNGTNIKQIPLAQLSNDIINDIYNKLSGATGTKGIGKEENFLVAFYDNIIKEKKGDISVNGQKYEIKGEDAILVPSNLSRGSFKNDIKPYLESFSNNLILKLQKTILSDKPATINILKNEFDKIILKSKESEGWTNRVKIMYENYIKEIKSTIKNISNNELNKLFISTLENELGKIYGNVDLTNIVKENLFSPDLFKKTIASYLINNLNINEPIMFVSSEGIIKIFNDKEEIIEAINNGSLKITALSDAIPRLTFNK